MPSYVNPPVLVVGFNRPELMREQLIRLRDIRPSRLYVACDGPRPGREADIQTTTAVKESIELVDWPCEVQTLFQDQNLGCGKGVSTAITWFLQHEPGGIILEDDVVATPDFHNFAGEMLQRYADDPRVWSVMGLSLDRPDVRARQTNSYRFTTMPQVWGWATWATTWESFTLDISDWPAWLDLDAIAREQGWSWPLTNVVRRRLSDIAAGKVDAWAPSLAARSWQAGGLHVMPRRALTTNVGVFVDATHPGYEPTQMREPESLDWPLTEPFDVTTDHAADTALFTDFFEGTWSGYARKAIRRVRNKFGGA